MFPGMTVEENLLDGRLPDGRPRPRRDAAAERVFDKYPRLAARRSHQAKVLSGGERRLLEISRALVMNPEMLLVDEPSIGLEPRFIDMVFEILARPSARRGQDDRDGRAERQEGARVRRHRLRAGVGPGRNRGQRARTCSRTPTWAGCSSAAEAPASATALCGRRRRGVDAGAMSGPGASSISGLLRGGADRTRRPYARAGRCGRSCRTACPSPDESR